MKKKAKELIPDDWVKTPRGFIAIKSVYFERSGMVRVQYSGLIESMVGKVLFDPDEEIEVKKFDD